MSDVDERRKRLLPIDVRILQGKKDQPSLDSKESIGRKRKQRRNRKPSSKPTRRWY